MPSPDLTRAIAQAVQLRTEPQRLQAGGEPERVQLASVLEHLPIGVRIAEAPSGRIIFGNSHLQDILGQPGLPLASVEEYSNWTGFHPDGRRLQPHEWPLARAVRFGEVTDNEELQCSRGDGTRIWLAISASPIYDVDGWTIVAGVESLTDIDARKRAEERVSALEELDRLKDEAIAIASHDITGPITSMSGYAQLLLRHLAKPEPNTQLLEEGLTAIREQATLMGQLVVSLLDSSRIQAGAMALQIAPCDLEECLAGMLARLNPSERGRIAVRLDDVPLAGAWDQQKIEQVLANLIRNALKYSAGDSQVNVAAKAQDGQIEVAVSDRGIGIRADELPVVFERFYRAPEALTAGLPGAGLGLYICRGIVEAHGGRLWAESAGQGQGATFRFRLPRRQTRLLSET